jgi:hypothetical protein
MQNVSQNPPQTIDTTYVVYKGADALAAGSLKKCWEWLLNNYGERLSEIGGARYASHSIAIDLAEAGIYIAPAVSKP